MGMVCRRWSKWTESRYSLVNTREKAAAGLPPANSTIVSEAFLEAKRLQNKRKIWLSPCEDLFEPHKNVLTILAGGCVFTDCQVEHLMESRMGMTALSPSF